MMTKREVVIARLHKETIQLTDSAAIFYRRRHLTVLRKIPVQNTAQ